MQQNLLNKDEHMRQVVAELEHSKSQLTRKLEQVTREHNAECAKLKQNAHQLKQGAVNAQLEMLSLSEGLAEVGERETNQLARITELNQKLETERQLNGALTNRVKELENEIHTGVAEQKQLMDKNRFIRHLASDKKTIEDSLTQVTQRLSKAEALNEELSRQLEHERNLNQEQLIVAAAQDKEIRSVQSQKMLLEREAAVLEQRVTDSARRENETVEQLAAERSNLEEMRSEKEQMRAKQQSTEAQLEEMNNNKKMLGKDLDRLQEELDKVHGEHEQMVLVLSQVSVKCFR